MAAVDYLADQGFAVQIEGDRLMVAPSSNLTDELRDWIRAHRSELMNDAARYQCWAASLNGESRGRINTKPCSYAEALAAARFHWPGSDVTPVETSRV